MKEGAYVSEAIDYQTVKKGQINSIYANCGSGKSTAIYHDIPAQIGVSEGNILVLIDTSAGRDSFIKSGQAEDFIDRGFVNLKPTIMTYAAFGAKVKADEINLDDYEMIVCDEIHAMRRPVCIERGKLVKQFPQAKPWEINDMLKITCFNYIAIETISDIAEAGEKWVFGLTATPRQAQKIEQFQQLIREVKFSQALRAYEIISSFQYSDIEEILRKSIPEDTKRAFYFCTVKELKKYKQVLLESGRKAEAIWSLNHSEKMDGHQLSTRDYILEEHKLPDDVQDLLFNAGYETAITIKDDKVKECYVHSGNPDTQIQARNRFRQDLNVVGYYDSEMAKNKKKDKKNKEEVLEGHWVMPDNFLNIPLDKEARENLLKTIGFPKGWTSFKKWLAINKYKITEKRVDNKRYQIIS